MTLTHPHKSHPQQHSTDAMTEALAILSLSKLPLGVNEIVSVSRHGHGEIRWALKKLRAAGKIVPAPGRKWTATSIESNRQGSLDGSAEPSGARKSKEQP